MIQLSLADNESGGCGAVQSRATHEQIWSVPSLHHLLLLPRPQVGRPWATSCPARGPSRDSIRFSSTRISGQHMACRSSAKQQEKGSPLFLPQFVVFDPIVRKKGYGEAM